MGFEQLLGNERLKENLTRSLRRDRVPHFYLIAGPEGSGKHTLARLLAAGLLCREADRPCLGCQHCRKALSGTHPDLITVDDPDKKTVPVDLIRQARADIYIRPNEAERKVYLFPRAQDLGLPGQNALLKVLEEPPAYGVFLLLTDNPEKLLPTVRSRCTELNLLPLSDSLLRSALAEKFPQARPEDLQAAITRSGGYLGQAEKLLAEGDSQSAGMTEFTEAMASRSPMALMHLLVPMERWKRDALLEELNRWTALLEHALACRSGMPAVSRGARTLAEQMTSPRLMQAIRHLQKAAQYTQSNVSPAAVCGYLEWALR